MTSAVTDSYCYTGTWLCTNMSVGLSGISLALFTRALGWEREAVEVFLVDVRKDIKDRSKHSYWPMWVFAAPSKEANSY